jgi:outer membrane protein assembly factor BamB
MSLRPFLFATVLLVGGTTAVMADDWPQWRGPNRDDISKEKGLLKEWPKGGPKLLGVWKNAGLGFSGPAVIGNIVYTMGAGGPAGKEQEYAVALDFSDPQKVKELWAVPLGPMFTWKKNYWGDGPRSTPTVDGDFVYFLAAYGELACLKRGDGAVVWRKNLVKDFGGQVMEFVKDMNWGFCESPLIDGDRLICCPGGSKGWMLALNKKTGDKLWQTKDITEEATDSSTVVAEIGGVRQYINTAFKDEKGGLLGIEAATGKVLWFFKRDYDNSYAVCPTPVVKDDLVYITAGYNAGCNLVQVANSGGKFTPKDIYNAKARKLMKNDHGGVVLVDGYIYGYSDGLGWVCQELKSGKELWSERNQLDGKGSLTCAEGMLYLLSDRGEACLIEASPKGWTEKGRFTLPELSPSHENRPTHQSALVWTHPVVANGRLYLRDQELIYCYSVKQGG